MSRGKTFFSEIIVRGGLHNGLEVFESKQQQITAPTDGN